MRYVKFSDLDDAQKEAASRFWGTNPPEKLPELAFNIDDHGVLNERAPARLIATLETIDKHGYPASQGFGKTTLSSIFDGPKARPEKGDIHHLKTCEFALNKEPDNV